MCGVEDWETCASSENTCASRYVLGTLCSSGNSGRSVHKSRSGLGSLCTWAPDLGNVTLPDTTCGARRMTKRQSWSCRRLHLQRTDSGRDVSRIAGLRCWPVRRTEPLLLIQHRQLPWLIFMMYARAQSSGSWYRSGFPSLREDAAEAAYARRAGPPF